MHGSLHTVSGRATPQATPRGQPGWSRAALLGLCALLATAAHAGERVVHAAGAVRDGEAVAVAAESSSPTPAHELLAPQELEELVGPVALYPDDLLAIVLPAATYPLEIVEAARYLEAVEEDPDLTPDEDWHEPVVALLNYPEVVAKLSEDLDWTWSLGQAVLNQEDEVLAAVKVFRRKAYAAGNLPSDRRQRVEVRDQAVMIRPADPSVLYIPYYEPRLMHVRHRRPVYHYYPRPCPVYYYPYPAGHYLLSRYDDRFWGLTSVFSIGWRSGHLNFHLLEHRSHPYFGHAYAYRHYRYWEPRLLHAWRYHDHPSRRHLPGNRWDPNRDGHQGRPPAPAGAEPPLGRPPADAAALARALRAERRGEVSPPSTQRDRVRRSDAASRSLHRLQRPAAAQRPAGRQVAPRQAAPRAAQAPRAVSPPAERRGDAPARVRERLRAGEAPAGRRSGPGRRSPR